VISLLKRWLLGTHQGAIAQEHLDDYLDEFIFRFNRRTSKSRGKLFYRLAQQAVQAGPTPFSTLVKPQPVAVGGVKQIPLLRFDSAESSLNVTVPSAFALGWAPTLLTNFQVDGFTATSASSTMYLDDLTIKRW
jgi:hypothetical protein